MHNSDDPKGASLLSFTLLLSWGAITTTWWWLAFARLEAAPEWLRRTQSVCFGTLPNGLPDTYGWMTLILAPLSILLGLLVIYDDQLEMSAKRMLRKPLGAALAMALLAGASLQAGLTTARVVDASAIADAARSIPATDEEMPATYPRLDRVAPPLQLVDQHGAPVTLSSFSGAPFVVAFTFAHCQTVCPTLVRQVRAAASSFPTDTPVVYVTLDPWRDTPSALPTIAKQWGLEADERVLSGSVEAVNLVLDGFQVPRGRDENTGDVTHPALAYVVDGNGRIAYALEGATLSWLGEAVRRASMSSALATAGAPRDEL